MSATIESEVMQRVRLRLLPLLFLIYVSAFLDRSNVGVAALQMNGDLGFGPAVFGLGAGFFYLGYAALEVPSNLILTRVGAQKWIARIAISWGAVSCAMIWVRSPAQFYTARFFLGVAEAGFFPGLIYYLNRWFPAPQRARAIAAILIGIPLSQVLGGALGGLLLGTGATGRLSGWQWLFLVEGLPPILLGVIAFRYLTEDPSGARWLTAEQRSWLSEHIGREQQHVASGSALRTLFTPLVWILSLPNFALFAVSISYLSWAPILVRGALGTSNRSTAFIVTGISLLVAPMYPIAARVSDRYDERCGVAALGLGLLCAGCIGLTFFAASPMCVIALASVPLGNALFLSSFWCLPARFLKGTPAAAGIALINSIGASGGFFGPSLVGYLKQTTGGYTAAFIGLAGLSLAGILVCLVVRQLPTFKPAPAAS